MKTIEKFFRLFIITVILFGNVYADPDLQNESTGSFKVSKGGKLYVNVNPGDVKIQTWDKNEVVVKVRGLENEEADDLEMKLDKNTVRIEYSSNWGWSSEVEFYISIPSQFNVEVYSSGGDIGINGNVYGEVVLNTMGGDINLKNVKGRTKVNTQGGDIETGEIEGALDVSTMGGDVKLGDVRGESAKVSTMGGDIIVGKVSSGLNAVTYGGDILVKSIGGNADVRTMGGDVDLGNVSGSVNMSTNGGNLTVKSASGKVQANTYAGEIELHGITGSVDAKTSAGNIYVEINPSANSYSKLYANSGSITVSLPSSAKATVEAEIGVRGYWKSMKDVYKIYSEFDSKSYKTDEDSRTIKATYVINGGGGKIYAKSVNENITLKKSK